MICIQTTQIKLLCIRNALKATTNLENHKRLTVLGKDKSGFIYFPAVPQKSTSSTRHGEVRYKQKRKIEIPTRTAPYIFSLRRGLVFYPYSKPRFFFSSIRKHDCSGISPQPSSNLSTHLLRYHQTKRNLAGWLAGWLVAVAMCSPALSDSYMIAGRASQRKNHR